MKVLFRIHLYSNSSTGLEKSAQGVWNTPPSPIFGAQLALLEVGGKRSFIFFQKTSESWGQSQRDKGIQERVISKIKLLFPPTTSRASWAPKMGDGGV